MKRLRNWQFVTGVSLLLVGLGILTAVLLRTPEREITRTELAALIQAKDFSHGRVTPTPYSGIYHIEGTRKQGNKTEKFFITTHLDETQIKNLFEQSGVKVEVPGQGVRGQWVNILSTLLIAGLVIMLVLLGRAATGAYSAEEHAGVEVATYYWHFVDIVWIGLFTTIFVVR